MLLSHVRALKLRMKTKKARAVCFLASLCGLGGGCFCSARPAQHVWLLLCVVLQDARLKQLSVAAKACIDSLHEKDVVCERTLVCAERCRALETEAEKVRRLVHLPPLSLPLLSLLAV